MKQQLEVDFVLVSGQIMVRLDAFQFQQVIAEEELTVILGYIEKSIFKRAPAGYYYIASNGALTYYLRVSKPIDTITPNIIADTMSVQLYPPQQWLIT